MTAATDRPIAFFDMQAQQAPIRAELNRRIAAVLDSGRFVLGPEVTELEAKLCEYAGAKHAVGVSSGTDALQIAMMGAGIGRGDAVFLPAFTYTATAEVPLVLGATPVFVDVDPRTFNIDLADLRRRIAAVKADGKLRPRAVVGVDLFGLPADWPALLDLCAAEGMFALDDAAQAFGASLHGKKLGTWAHATALSFYPTKTLGGYGDGGALLTDDAETAELYRSLRSHGEGTTRYQVLRTGMNGRLDTLQAAILLCKLPLMEEELRARTEVAGWYGQRLSNAVQLTAEIPGAVHAFGYFPIVLPDAGARPRVQEACKAAGVPTAIYYPLPLHHQPAYRDHHAGAAPLPVSEDLATRILHLPIHAYMDEAQADRVCQAVRSAL
ncbi:DegT/DnrJ/EryC1/StrS family aminotransferase [Roseomonas sp. OT10]|uniref:DegT/DnrJ/EryC1/StrS family aminotransferase n=1 Tax=Roseomonas cutis TaxID=2897332 RepID=UPI001E2E9C1C|nr:DegT/DnrJ/EryC1/StrS family aminotransferase [Roseomonas sp. OT10]UFN50491.1 DegT/DnrJ/EryC1/StrS family aminotransferase [Roseomonas sp. OT10]